MIYVLYMPVLFFLRLDKQIGSFICGIGAVFFHTQVHFLGVFLLYFSLILLSFLLFGWLFASYTQEHLGSVMMMTHLCFE